MPAALFDCNCNQVLRPYFSIETVMWPLSVNHRCCLLVFIVCSRFLAVFLTALQSPIAYQKELSKEL